MIPRRMIEEARHATERLAAGAGCPTVLMELLDKLEAGAPVEVQPSADQRRDGPMVLARPRQNGKTSELIQWLINGHRVEDWPGWSRVIVTPTTHQQKIMLNRWAQQVDPLIPGGLSKVVITAAELHNRAPGKRIQASIEIGFDDVDTFLWSTLSVLPDVITMTARPVATLPGPDPRQYVPLPHI